MRLIALARGNRRPLLPMSSFRPEGLRRRPTSDQRSPLRPVVWIFYGCEARYASGVFETLDAALAWAGKHEVSEILTEYPWTGDSGIASQI
ncbi:DUF7710 domain-containing protein [Microbispora hainanensis]|uniref:DUF7710 domain-containing protein n=1 Tax=Microbispora hainanensis TaxID=568844 RepID=UPI003CC76B21